MPLPQPKRWQQYMRATEVLKQYVAGRRDFKGENLRGQSFKGKILSGANFSAADIRGTNFTNATLTGAKFSGTKAGLERRSAIGLVIASWILSALSGLFSGFLGYVVAFIFDKDTDAAIFGGFALIVLLAIFFIITIRKGLVAGLVTFAVGVAGDVAVAGAVVGAVAGAVGVARAVGITGAVAGAEARTVAGTVAGAVALLNAYISWRAFKGDERDAWLRTFAIAFAATRAGLTQSLYL